MGLTTEQTASLTLADLEAIAARFAAAVAAIREAQALLGGTAPPVVAPTPARIAPQAVLTPEQQRELDNWRNGPARAKLLEQIRGSEEIES